MNIAMAALLGLALVMGGGCREETPAMKKANLGRALMERGSLDRAIGTLNDAIRLDPKLVMAYEFLGQSLERVQRYPEAVMAYREAVRLDPVRDSAFTSLGCLLLSTQGDREEARHALTQALALNTTHSVAHACLGALYLDERDMDAAIASSSRALSLNPQNLQAHLNLGIAYMETGDDDKARDAITWAITLAGSDSAFGGQAKMILEALNHPDLTGSGADGRGGAPHSESDRSPGAL